MSCQGNRGAGGMPSIVRQSVTAPASPDGVAFWAARMKAATSRSTSPDMLRKWRDQYSRSMSITGASANGTKKILWPGMRRIVSGSVLRPGVAVVVDVAAPGQRLMTHPDASLCGKVAQGVEIIGGAGVKGLRQAFEIAEGLKQGDLRHMIARHGTNLSQGVVRGDESLLKDFDPVKARARHGRQLFGNLIHTGGRQALGGELQHGHLAPVGARREVGRRGALMWKRRWRRVSESALNDTVRMKHGGMRPSGALGGVDMQDLRAGPIRVGLIGAGIEASLTPALHVNEGGAQGLAYRYDLIDLAARGLDVTALPRLIDEAEAAGFAGLNITHPAKQLAVRHVSDLSPDARALGAINTIRFQNGQRMGHNTDWWGFDQSFRRGLPKAALGHVVLLGAGGAGVAVAHALGQLGARSVAVFDLDPARSGALVQRIGPAHPFCAYSIGTDLAEALRTADGLVHATPTGMITHPGLPLPEDLLQARHWVAEIVYFPLETALLKTAAAKGCRVLNGGGMAVFQAVKAFEIFSGVTPNADRMLSDFEDMIRRGKPRT